MLGIDHEEVEHFIQINPRIRPIKHKFSHLRFEWAQKIKDEVNK